MKARCGDLETAWFEIGRGEPVILIHGLGDDHRAWRKVVPWLALRRRVILYDFRGHGQTSLGQADGTLRQLSRDLLNLMDAIDLEKASLAGFSLGGTIALRTAIDNPERVERLFPVATSSRVGSKAAAWYQERVELVEAGDPRLPAVIEEDTSEVYRNAPAELEAGLLIRRQSTEDPRGYGNACRAMAGMNSEPLDPELERISAPTRVIAADRDQHCPPRAGELIASQVPGATLHVLEGAGHPIPAEKPQELADLLLS